jgi:two-component system, cell cycle sensor histidine kinase and response regulator CckA
MNYRQAMVDFFSSKRWPFYFSGIIIIVSLVITAGMNIINSLVWWGRIDRDLILIGCIDSLVVTLLVSPIAVYLIRNYFNLEEMNRSLQEEIAQRHKVEEALVQNEKNLLMITDNSRDVIWMLDMNFRFTFLSPSIEQLLGYPPEDYLAKSHQEILSPDSYAQMREALTEELRIEDRPDKNLYRSRMIDTEQIQKDGTKKWIEHSMTFLRDSDRRPVGILGFSRDITDKRVVAEALKASEEQYQLLFSSIREVVYSIDLNFTITSMSPSMEKYLGYRKEEFIGNSVLDLKILPKEYYKKGLSDIARVLQGEILESEEYAFLAKDGQILYAEVSGAPIVGNGKIIGMISVARDITARKEAEKTQRALEDRLHRAEKMEALGTLAGGVAHDLNNIFGVLVGYSELLGEKFPKDSSLSSYADNILRSGLRGAAIVQDLLTLTRRGVAVLEVVDLNRIVSDYLRTPEYEKLKSEHREVRLRMDLTEGLLKIKGSPIHLSKAIANLVFNAAEAMSGQGEITIKTEDRYLDIPLKGYDDVREGDYSVLTVSDTGNGIPVKDMQKIFEPFYTNKVMGRSGTGLGLAVVWGTVKDHHGYIDVRSEEGKGSTFTVYLPITREEIAERGKAVDSMFYMGKGEAILVVDDVKEQRELAVSMLHSLGYEAEAVASGEEAIDYLGGKTADLMVLDMIMEPGIDGLETYERVLGVNPKQRAIIVSGFSETERVRTALTLGAGAYVRKPYMIEKIGVAIRNELDR